MEDELPRRMTSRRLAIECTTEMRLSRARLLAICHPRVDRYLRPEPDSGSLHRGPGGRRSGRVSGQLRQLPSPGPCRPQRSPATGRRQFHECLGTAHDQRTDPATCRPPCRPSNRGGLSEETYTNIVAFFLQANGAPAGDRPLAVSTPVRIDAVANGQMPPALREALAKAATADQAMAPARPCA